MKVAFILEMFPSLSETFILNQITGLIDLGHEVDLFSKRKPDSGKAHQDVSRYKLFERVKYLPEIPRNRIMRNIVASLYLIIQVLKGPVRTIRFFHASLNNPINMPILSCIHWFRLLSRKPYDILHCHYGPMGQIGILLRHMGINAKVCTTFHGFDISRYISNKDDEFYETLFTNGDIFLPISEYWKQRLLALQCPKEKIFVHHMGIDPRKFEYHPPNMSKEDPLTVLTVGRLTEKKGHAYAIRAVAKLYNKKRAIRYWIAGDGHLRKELQDLAELLEVNHIIQFLGAMNHHELIRLYRESQVFMLPSIDADDGDMEGIPVVLMEAMSSGLPVISTYHSGIPELVKNNISGLLVPQRDVDALSTKLTYLLEHPDIAIEMGCQGRTYAEKYFNIHTLNKRLVEIYKNVSGS